ncbi:hypothetical protein [Pseudomonas nitroreducens]|uniref:hypothetical protein n=1 Tax=Pseudomonas nitroreducens TaxID=46680 RepID=UPI00265A2B78|nr:hypothetical protein [Pseudomonas nitroreducens]MCP1651637.1 hypothetical protein [Pseudomonas nitroreducens]MCP1684498.1 hypothetical protein [Pseudomonas nitroreducens]
MSAAEKIDDEFDKVSEKRMAELLGTTARALQRKRERKIIPAWIWAKIDGRIIYSKRRYDEWLESLWTCRPASKSSANQSEFGFNGESADVVKRSPTLRPRKESQRQQLYVLR